jgi:uncharacterized phage protein (TIGR01671 family)
MRPIEFRAWDEETEKMYYPDDECTFVIEANQLRCFVPQVIPMTRDEPEHIVGRELVHLMQFTGLLDKNGTEIYEGDIISNGTSRLCKVKWHKWTGQWDAIPITKNKGNADNFVCEGWKNCEIIGNIHENPELLKASQ